MQTEVPRRSRYKVSLALISLIQTQGTDRSGTPLFNNKGEPVVSVERRCAIKENPPANRQLVIGVYNSGDIVVCYFGVESPLGVHKDLASEMRRNFGTDGLEYVLHGAIIPDDRLPKIKKTPRKVVLYKIDALASDNTEFAPLSQEVSVGILEPDKIVSPDLMEALLKKMKADRIEVVSLPLKNNWIQPPEVIRSLTK